MSIQRSRLLALIEYLQHSVRSRTKVVSNVTDYGRFLALEQQLAALDGVKLNDGGDDGDDELWLSVPRPPNPEPPPKADDPWLAPWLAVGGPLLQEPRLAPAVDGWDLIAAGTHRDARHEVNSIADIAQPGVSPDERVRLSDYDFRHQVEAQFAAYLEAVWQPWAEAERRRRRLSRLYVQLFTLQQELAGAIVEGQLELVWGIGLAVWKDKDTNVAHPLISRLVDVTFNPETGAAEVRPRDVDPRLELDAFAAQDHPGVSEAERRAKEFFAKATTTLSPFDPGTYQPLLSMIKDRLEHHGDEPLPGDLSLARGEHRLTVTDTWVLFARPRSANPLLRDLEHFMEAVSARPDDAPLPGAVSALVTEPSAEATPVQLPSFRGVSAAYHERGQGVAADDLYFPQPFNDEQLRIAQLLEASDGVVVQGPPGTGKTHTIANVICHWLANGRRVLVTSMKDPALAVLRDKLPEPIRPLAISLLASEQEGMERFEQSIRTIASEVQSIDPVSTARDIAQLEETINGLHARLLRIDTDARRWARLNLSRIEMEGESIDPADAAQELITQSGRFEWLPDPLGVGPQFRPRFGVEDVNRLREARRRLGRDIEYAGCSLPAALPDAQLLLQAHRDLARFRMLSAETRSGSVPRLADARQQSFALLRETSAEIERINALREDVARAHRPWTAALRERLRGGGLAEQFALLEKLGQELDLAAVERRAFLGKPVELPPQAELDAELVKAVDNLAQGKRAFSLASAFGKGGTRRNLDAVRVNGRAPADAQEWQHVSDCLALRARWDELTVRWNTLAPELGFDRVPETTAEQRMPGGSSAPGLVAAAQFALYRKVKALIRAELKLAQQVAELFPAWPGSRGVADDTQLFGDLARAVAHHLAVHRLDGVWSVRDSLGQAFERASGPVVDQMRNFLASVLGNPEVDDARLLESWSALTAELSRVQGLSAALGCVEEVSRLVAESGAPQYAQALRQPVEGEIDLLLPAEWAQAWRLRRLATHLAAIDAQDEFKKLAVARADLEHDLARGYSAVVVKRAWLKLTESATPSVRAALQAYLNAVQKIGKGTGKRAVRYRQDARNAAAEAITAVPCWIMPHYRVSESLPAQLGCFDLVVIDEASQSDLSALPTLLRARKLLIVGDDKQVSPEGVGLEEQKIKALMQRFLAEQVPIYRAQMSPERSIYDLAKVVFARSGVVLKEHFRCVASIIEYSKREFYDHELRPLRLALPSERLDPALVDVLVDAGKREGGVNVAEIDFIVQEIGRLTADPRMLGRSIGVVSLLGEEQALAIWDRLNDEFGPQLLQRHRLACGDARTFQGRERDVIFLSLVSAPNDVGAPLSRDIFAQRFNVAASRARDRMYLVRSVGLDHLSDGDRLRRSLIAHFARPFAQDEPHSDPRERCESPFERQLYDWLTQQGYRATPQVRVGAYRVDLVVEGSNDARLAVECDGDKREGPEKWLDDIRRQRVLERAGWTFWRCYAAAFVRRRQAVLEDLRAALSALGIEPASAQPAAPRAAQTPRRRAGEQTEARTVVVQAAAIQWGVPAPERRSPDHKPVPTETPRSGAGSEPGG
ncbi:MAG TPA: AAA domain-containing protein [Burkholderiales bacterium]|nr:AAA domain-containing protein [Burkholderiales bacterium]